jgi:hypothetical protein
MDVKEIVADWLRSHGYDGLAGPDCGCLVDDLMPCCEVSVYHCAAGMRGPCDPVTCPAEGRCDWHVVPSASPSTPHGPGVCEDTSCPECYEQPAAPPVPEE